MVPLTTIDQPKQEMGRRQRNCCWNVWNSICRLGQRIEVFQQHLVIRESCAVAPAANSSRLEFANRERA